MAKSATKHHSNPYIESTTVLSDNYNYTKQVLYNSKTSQSVRKTLCTNLAAKLKHNTKGKILKKLFSKLLKFHIILTTVIIL